MLNPGGGTTNERVVVAVFRAFAYQWRRLPRRTVVATWLVRTTWLAVRCAQNRLGIPMAPKVSAIGVRAAFFRILVRLRTALLDAVILHHVPSIGNDGAVGTFSRAERHTASVTGRGLVRLEKLLRRKVPGTDARALLAEMVCPVPAEFEQAVVGQLAGWSRREPKGDLVRAIRRAWQWGRLRRALRFTGAAIGTGFILLTVVVVTMAWSLRQGHLTRWFFGQSSRRMAKEMPEVAQAARPWLEGTEGRSVAAPHSPPSAAELYGLTNVWQATLSLTPSQWLAIAPSHIPPVPRMMGPDGKLQLRNPKAKRSGLAGVVGLEFGWVQAHLEFAGRSLSPVGVRYRGNGTYLNSLFGPKQSFKVDLDKYVKGQHLAGVHTLNFVNAIPDNSYMHDALGQQLFRELAVPSPRTAYAYLTLDVPGRYARQALGLYVLIENVDEDFAAERFGDKAVPIFKPVTTELFAYLGEDWSSYADIYDLKTRATPQQLDRVIEFARLVTRADDAEFVEHVADYLDLHEFAGFLAGHVLLASYDGFLSNGQNFYLYLDPRSNRFGFIAWDQDHGWGEFGYVATADRRERASIWKPSTYRNRFLDRVLEVEAFRDVYRSQLERALAGPFSVECLYPRIDELASIIQTPIAAESDFRRQRFDVAVSTNWLTGPRDGAPEGPRAPVHQIKRFIGNRVRSVRDQLDGKVQGEVLGR